MQDSTCWFVIVMITMTIRQHYNFKNALPFWCFHNISRIHNFLISLVQNFLCTDEWKYLRISLIDLSRFPCFGFHEFWFIYIFFFPLLFWDGPMLLSLIFITFAYEYQIIIIIFFSISSFCFIFLNFFFLALLSFFGFAHDQEEKFMQWVHGIQLT
jgi:hypothetical protein